MKTLLTLAAASLALTTLAQPDPAPNGYPLVLSPAQVIAAGPHDRLWQSLTVDSPGVTNLHAYTEIGTGLNFWDEAAGVYRQTVPAFQLTPAGYALATNGQHRLIVSPDIAAPGAIDFLGPDGLRLLSNPLCLAFRDAASGQETLLAPITNCQGQLTAPNMVTFPRAFAGLKAAINYTYRCAGIEQDVILYQRLPDPAALGLDPANTTLEIWTEFLDPPEPVVTSAETGSDQVLDFGQTRMGPGTAYLLNNAGLQPVALQKTWTNILERHFLIESVSYQTLKPLLDTLQASTTPGLKPPTARHLWPDRKTLLAKELAHRRKPLETAAIKPAPRGMEPAVVLDYQTLSTSQSNYTFAADMTYYVSAPVTLSGTPVFEGGTVIKLAPTNSVGLAVLTSAVWGGTNCRPTVITARDDNNVGETITGSTGNPTTNYYGAYALQFADGASPSYLRISYATEAIQFDAKASFSLSHAQVENCNFVADNEGHSISFTLDNVLLSSNLNLSTGAAQIKWYGEQVTAHWVTNRYDNTTFTNSLFAATSGFSGGTSNAFVNPDTGVFQTVGAGAHYLAANSPYRQAGTTNLASSTLAYLSQRTTYPPMILSSLSGNTTLFPQAARDFGPAPDLGYHYDPLDYCLTGLNLTNTLLLTNGVALGMYGSYGINLSNNATLISQGTPTSLNRLVRFASVQELSTNWGNAGSSSFSLLNVGYVSGTFPQVSLRFTDLSFLANTYARRYIINPGGTPASLTSLAFQDCTICGGALNLSFEGDGGPPTLTLAMTNNLVLRPYFALYQDDGAPNYLMVQAWNNLFQCGYVGFDNDAGSPTWEAFDNLFDRSTVDGGPQNGYNGYVTNYTKFSGSSGGDVILTNAPVYQSSWLGNYYYPTNDGMLSLLINAGSCTAPQAGLYHYTTTTNQVIEGTSQVDIGFHFVATDSNGNPLDYNGDGIPDYLSDANGNGTVDSGEIAWNVPGDLGLFIFITRPPNGATLP